MPLMVLCTKRASLTPVNIPKRNPLDDAPCEYTKPLAEGTERDRLDFVQDLHDGYGCALSEDEGAADKRDHTPCSQNHP